MSFYAVYNLYFKAVVSRSMARTAICLVVSVKTVEHAITLTEAVQMGVQTAGLAKYVTKVSINNVE